MGIPPSTPHHLDRTHLDRTHLDHPSDKEHGVRLATILNARSQTTTDPTMVIWAFTASPVHLIQTRQTQWTQSLSHPPAPRNRYAQTKHAPKMCDPTIEEQFASPDYLQRIRAINRVEQSTSTNTQVDELVRLAKDDQNPQVRYAAISRLSNLDSARLSDDSANAVLQVARHALEHDKEPSCKAGAADLIAGLKLTEGFDDLINIFNTTDDWMLKFSVAAGLGEMGDARAFDFLAKILEDGGEEADFLLITAAIGSLGELGDKRALPAIEKYLDHKDSSIQERAQIAHAMLSAVES